MNDRKTLFNLKLLALTVTCVVFAGCGDTGGFAGLGNGLPGCDSAEAKQIVKSALMNHLKYREGDMCFMQDHTGAESDPVGRAGFRPDPLGHSMAECKEAPNGRDFVPVRDFTFELRDYLVEGEAPAQDGRSMSCEVSTAYVLGSNEQPQFAGPGITRRLSVRYFNKTDSGDRRYEANVYRQ